jgi:peptidyl-tRNA hydrolase, PTH1 family
MHIVVGLGNPGPRYQLTRHNIGFLVIDALIPHLGARALPDNFNAKVYEYKGEGLDVKFVKPQTFMNLSGEAVQPLMAYYKVPLENLIVIQDDIDQAFGKLKLQKKRGDGGHNGIKSINEKLGTNEYARLKLGVGRPSHPQMQVVDYVLQNFGKDQDSDLADFISRAAEATLSFLDDGFERAQNEFNSKDANTPTAE